MTAGHIGDLAPDRRHAVLLATIIAIETDLTDATLFMFDKLMGSLARRAENRTSARAALSVRDMQKPLRIVTATCRVVLRAIAAKRDVAAAIDRESDLAAFVRCLAEVETLTASDMTGNKADLIGKYATVRMFAPALLGQFTFRGGGSVARLLKALAIIADLYRTGKRALPRTLPTGFIKRAWRPFVFKDGGVDRKAYELCALSELRGCLSAGEIWVERSRQYQAFEANLIPEPTFALLKAAGPLPVAVELDAEKYLAGRRAALNAELERVARLADAGELQDIERHFLGASIVELCRPRRGVVSHLRRALQSSAVLEVGGHACRPKRMITDLGGDVGRPRPPLDHCIGVRLGQGIAGELPGRPIVALEQKRLRIAREPRAVDILVQIGFEIVVARHGVPLPALLLQAHP
jgi:hypothetical protein